jgi:glycerol-3-phosphate dehydrogenase (NAD(P)+)
MISEIPKIAVLGAGSWGIAFSVHLHGRGYDVDLWEFEGPVAEMLNAGREHPDKLPGVTIPGEIKIRNDIEDTIRDADIIAFALPSHTVRGVCRLLPKPLENRPLMVNLAKGIENKTLMRMSEVILDEIGAEYGPEVMTLSGPSHAEEVSLQIPTSVAVAGSDMENLMIIQNLFSSNSFRIYTNDDLTGVELAGSLKNIIAIAAGICDGLEFGDNTKGALLTRGLAEITRLGLRMGAKPETFAGLAGLGDLITTCLSCHSRNRFVGEQVGRGRKIEEVLNSMKMVAEGVKTTESAYELMRKYDVDMPITNEVYSILFDGKSPKEAVTDLMTRVPKPEVRL